LKKPHEFLPFYFLVIAYFLLITCRRLFTDGMWVDGVVYAAIARNIAEGMGTAWAPYFSETLFGGGFYEHPPLAFWAQSLFFRTFGDHLFVERFYSLCFFLVTAYFIHMLWREWGGAGSTSFLPLLFWVLTGGVGWACANNMLENTMALFVVLSVLLYYRYRLVRRRVILLLSGGMLTLAFLTKGFVPLFPLSLPFWHLLLSRDRFAGFVADSLVMAAGAALPVAILAGSCPAAAQNLASYLDAQVISSLTGDYPGLHRWYIVYKFFDACFVPFAVMGFCWILQKRLRLPAFDWRKGLPLWGLTAAGVLPVMISLKQRPYYVLSVYPFVATALGFAVLPSAKGALERVNFKGAGFAWFARGAGLLLAVGIALTVGFWGRPGRDKDLLHDVYAIREVVAENSVIGLGPGFAPLTLYEAYFARYGKISLDRDHYRRELLLMPVGTGSMPKGYAPYGPETVFFQLLKKERHRDG
jgi:4-amino-4-deoxy-L-arabinose transferase-like glycosyltransferase